jgi:hypothetical protein
MTPSAQTRVRLSNKRAEQPKSDWDDVDGGSAKVG